MPFSNLIGGCPRFQALLDEINLAAPVDCAVLLRGETGTGKEVAARAIHEGSPRRGRPFVAINCAAIPSGLIESELFGHDRGAFTGAVTQTTGCFQAAHRGTLLLDEIGDLPLELQPKLLRVLQERQFERIGGHHAIHVDVRIIAATNQDLWSMVQERRFRADLYYRLNVLPIALPPLRDRKPDIPLLVQHFVEQSAARNGKSIVGVPGEVMEALKRYAWPGNIRELQNCIERAVIMTSGPELRLPAGSLHPESRTNVQATARTLAEMERDYISRILDEVGWVVGGRHGAAAWLGLSRTTLITRMSKLGISPTPGRDTLELQDAGESGGAP
jgi:formate hydrogenlyase transcriptional activator